VNARLKALNSQPIRKGAEYVLYWAQMNRRADSNHGLLEAADLANRLELPVLYYEGLTCSYPYASDRLHTFVLEGVPDTAARLKKAGIGYVFHLRKRRSDPDDALYALAKNAAAIVTDDYPTFIARKHNATVPDKVGIPYLAVDSSCIVPMRLMEKREWAAYTIRPKINRLLPQYLKPAPPLRVDRPFRTAVPKLHTAVTPGNIASLVRECEIDHSVPPSISWQGGRTSAEKHLRHFLEDNLRRYAKHRNDPSAHATSDMSPYLHFGQLSSLEIALAVRAHAEEHKLIGDEYLEEMIVRRELAFNFALYTERPDCLLNLPDWARKTMREHASDKRDYVYSRDQFEQARTHDALWNATQREMLLRGKIHGYYRMYWGKKIIEWSATMQDALETMVYLHDRFALDGRDPNTYTNILWCFGLHDRAWTERPIFGKLRYMSLDGMKRKTDTEAYLKEIEYLERTGTDPFRRAA
jgi:deoxyribodipyrimidine photo-lyase